MLHYYMLCQTVLNHSVSQCDGSMTASPNHHECVAGGMVESQKAWIATAAPPHAAGNLIMSSHITLVAVTAMLLLAPQTPRLTVICNHHSSPILALGLLVMQDVVAGLFC